MLTKYFESSNPKLNWNPDRSNRFLVIEGIDGSGKTSVVNELVDRFRKETNYEASKWYEPGRTVLGDAIRSLLKNPNLQAQLLPLESLFLLQAARVSSLVSMASTLKSNRNYWAISDRHIDSTFAYQGAEGIDERIISETYGEILMYPPTTGLYPCLTVFLDIPIDIAMKRIDDRLSERDVYDNKPREFFEKTQEIYHRRILGFKDGYLVLDANRPVSVIVDDIVAFLKEQNVWN